MSEHLRAGYTLSEPNEKMTSSGLSRWHHSELNKLYYWGASRVFLSFLLLFQILRCSVCSVCLPCAWLCSRAYALLLAQMFPFSKHTFCRLYCFFAVWGSPAIFRLLFALYSDNLEAHQHSWAPISSFRSIFKEQKLKLKAGPLSKYPSVTLILPLCFYILPCFQKPFCVTHQIIQGGSGWLFMC